MLHVCTIALCIGVGLLSSEVLGIGKDMTSQPIGSPPPPVGSFSETPDVSAIPISPPSDKTKHCPPEFEFLGKECVRVVTIPATLQCPPNSELTPANLCAVFIGKTPQCPESFTPLGDRCERRETSQPFSVCSPGYVLTNQDECAAPMEPVIQEECPAESLRRGDLCIQEEEIEPEFTCPPGYTIDGKKCRIEELYNCTPERPVRPSNFPNPNPTSMPIFPSPLPGKVRPSNFPNPNPTSIPIFPSPLPGKGNQVINGKINSGQQSYVAEGYRNAIRQAEYRQRNSIPTVGINGQQPWRRVAALRGFLVPPETKEFTPELIDYVVQATCKRIRTILAQKLCPRGVLNGKMCRIEVEVPPVANTAPLNSVFTDIRPAESRCPPGFNILSRTMCLLTELRSLIFVCPENTQDIGDRCATYAQATPVCPPGFALEGSSQCVQTLHASPITEFTVKYSCVGKDCAGPS